MADGRVAVCPGSYDPVTNGHLDIIGRVANVFDEVVVGVVGQAIRKQKSMFTPEERKEFLEEATADRDNVRIEIFTNLLVEFARDQGATAIVKGLRAISDFEYEFEMAQLNRTLAPEIESVYVIASAEVQLPLLDRRQGDGDLRRRRLRAGAAGGLGGARRARPPRVGSPSRLRHGPVCPRTDWAGACSRRAKPGPSSAFSPLTRKLSRSEIGRPRPHRQTRRPDPQRPAGPSDRPGSRRSRGDLRPPRPDAGHDPGRDQAGAVDRQGTSGDARRGQARG